jgi:tripartite-type tricarboxylate transporter receptor subunit TctC
MGARLLAPYLEKHLGVTVTVLNVEGANGWVGWTQGIKAKPDGYTLIYANYPAQIAGYLDPATNVQYTYRDFTAVSNHVTDINVLVFRPDEKRFRTSAEFVNYAKANELTITTGGRASDDHIAIAQINKNLGTKLTPVHMANTTEGIAAMLGSHVDGVMGNVSEFYQRLKAGECSVLAAFSPKRSSFMSTVPTFEEGGFAGIYGDSSRGLLAPPNLDSAVKEKLLRVIKDVMSDPEHTAAAEKIGAAINPMNGADFEKWLGEQEVIIKGLMSELK